MSDAETRKAIKDIISERCALRSVLTKKPCPYFGASGSCRDCTYDWMSVADAVRKVVDKRRASYEKERDKVKELKKQLDLEKARSAQLGDVVTSIGHGLQAFKAAVDLTEMIDQEKGGESTKEPEGEDGGQRKD